MRDLRLQLVLHQCFLNFQFPAMAQSIAPLLHEIETKPHRIEAEREAEFIQMITEFHVAYDRYVQRTTGPRIPIGEAWRRFSEGLLIVFDGEFFPCSAA